jgi:hypothetical protein
MSEPLVCPACNNVVFKPMPECSEEGRPSKRVRTVKTPRLQEPNNNHSAAIRW